MKKRFEYSESNPLGIWKIWENTAEQFHGWNDEYTVNIAALIEIVKDLPVFELPIAHMTTDNKVVSSQSVSVREFAQHCFHVLDADMNHPIILDKDGICLDGKHRMVRAILEGRESIKAVRLIEDPPLIKK